MSNFSSQTKEYLRIASRFLKEVGLYDLWIRYCYDPTKCKTWVDKEKCIITDIIGCTTFTDYVIKHRPEAVRNFASVYCLYEVFGEYVNKMHPEYGHVYSTRDILYIDKNKKKVRIR
jgi:hypothetical protein